MAERFRELSSRKRKRRTSGSRSKLPVNIQKNIESLFEKKFAYLDKESYCLNNAGKKTLSQEWQIEEFLGMKLELNTQKNELNDKNMITWHEHTKLVNLAGNIGPEVRRQVRPELCTQAWCKFYEIASSYLKVDDKPSIFTVHLCEAPGAFITSLHHYLYSCGYRGEWSWLATTLNPYYEGNNTGQMIDEDRLIRCSYDNWYFGEDGTGNLMSEMNLVGLKEKLCNVKVDLVTADGSIDCQGNPAEQENVVSRLQHTEVLTALHILAPGGTLVVKMFTMFECKAICLLYLLRCVFDKVEPFKPCTSKGGNSEVYVIGLGFKGRECCKDYLQSITPLYFGESDPEGCLFAREEIPMSFIEQHVQCIEQFKDWQMWTIQRNLDLYKVMNDEERSKVEHEKDYCTECFFNQYNINSLPYANRMMKFSKGKNHSPGRNTDFAIKQKLEGKFTGSFCERQELSTLPWQQKIHKIDTYEEEVDREDNSLWIRYPGEVILDEEMGTFQTMRGKPVDSIQSSRFCHGMYLDQVNEIVRKSQWLPLAKQSDSDSVRSVAQKLRRLLSDTIQYYNEGNNPTPETVNPQAYIPETEHMEVTERGVVNSKEKLGVHINNIREDLQKTSSDVKSVNENSVDIEQNSEFGKEEHVIELDTDLEQTEKIRSETVDVTDGSIKEDHVLEMDTDTEQTEKLGSETVDATDGSIKDSDEINEGGDNLNVACQLVSGESPVLEELVKESLPQCSGGDQRTKVRLYSVSAGPPCDKFELDEQKGLLSAVQDILKTCRESDYVVVEMGTCLSRFTAGLIYILYRCFREVGFVHNHGNLLKRHLVCVYYQHCPIRLSQCVEEVGRLMETDQSAAVLEIIPVLTLLEDEEFASFLTISNVNLAQSFITTVINEEKQMYCDGNKT